MSQRSFSFSNSNGSGSGTPTSENHHSHIHHFGSSSNLLNRSNSASRPGSPSTAQGAISGLTSINTVSTPSGLSNHSNNNSIGGGHSHNNSISNGSSLSLGAYESGLVGKSDSYFPPTSSSSTMDHSFSVGNSGYSKRSRAGAGLYSSTLTGKRWRWWNYTASALLIFAIVEGLILLLGSNALYSMPDQIQIGKDPETDQEMQYN
jgi:hypothetical protein